MSSAARSPEAAVRSLVADLRRAVSCVTESVLFADRGPARGGFAVVRFPAHHARAKLNRRRLWLAVEMEIESHLADEGVWGIRTLRYGFSIFGDERGADEWLAYHHHPATGPAAPHLHVNAEAAWAPRGLRRRHLLTGRVFLGDVVQMLIEDFGVSPLKATWRTDLARIRP